ncbi:hypothetical protein A3H38_02305 [candidate division WOR-1 bacterium RIFCSPLOWO2_02_FULL_46_20]|nr:MAG: hypothetical protein A3H38_02305 [candidate division WOR-1 bacterium RIFCSPLOWO2_02_FULL_46_20]
MRIAITGATGLLGRHLLFEVLEKNFDQLENLEVILFGRPQNGISLKDRFDHIVSEGIADYLKGGKEDREEIKKRVDKRLVFIPFDLTRYKLGLFPEVVQYLQKCKIDYFFHAAALSDFRNSPKITAMLFNTNLDGTKRILDLIKDLQIGEFVYTGSAYSAGFVEGGVSPDFINTSGKFRNPYERSKLEAEISIVQFAREHNLRYRIFRLTGIGGRLLIEPIGKITKYDIFYGWALFFFRQKMKRVKDIANIYAERVEMPIRIKVNLRGGMNVVPVDYAAKVIYAASLHNDEHSHYHLVNDIDIPNAEHVKIMLEALNIHGWTLVEKEPRDKNPLELLYYRSVGNIFTPYVATGPVKYNNSNLAGLHKKIGYNCPPMDEKNFKKLIHYAKNKYFDSLAV